MNFINPEYLWLLLFLVVGFIKKDFRGLSLVSFGYIITFIFIVIALTRPVIEKEPIQTKQLLSDVVVGVDLSFSMQAQDIKPTRLRHAKELLLELVQTDKNTRFGVLGYTTNAIILSPLTQDSELLLHLFSSLDESLIMTKGSNVMPALVLARKLSKSKKVSVVLLSDGGDELNYENEARFAKENNLVVNIMILGTSSGATLQLANGDLLEDELGDIVISSANKAIKVIADATDGVYSDDFSDIVSALNSQKEENIKTQTTIIQNEELFYYFVALAIFTFLVTITTLKKYLLIVFLVFGVTLHASTFTSIESANKLYKVGKYEKALQKYEMIKSHDAKIKSILFYNIGNTYVRLKEFKKARDAYLKSLTLSYCKDTDDNLRFIKNVGENKEMQTGQQKSAQKSSLAKKKESSEHKKEGGSSNMKVSAAASSGAQDSRKKSKSKSNVDMSKGKAKLSSKQYELINKRNINEKQPW